MRIIFRTLAFLAVLIVGSNVFAQTGGTSAKLSGFVNRSGSRLMLNGKPFRFAGANLDNVNLTSDRYSLIISITGKIDAYYPSKFAIDDAFETLHRMGGTVARVYSAGTQGSPLAIEPELGVFNEDGPKQSDQ